MKKQPESQSKLTTLKKKHNDISITEPVLGNVRKEFTNQIETLISELKKISEKIERTNDSIQELNTNQQISTQISEKSNKLIIKNVKDIDFDLRDSRQIIAKDLEVTMSQLSKRMDILKSDLAATKHIVHTVYKSVEPLSKDVNDIRYDLQNPEGFVANAVNESIMLLSKNLHSIREELQNSEGNDSKYAKEFELKILDAIEKSRESSESVIRSEMNEKTSNATKKIIVILVITMVICTAIIIATNN